MRHLSPQEFVDLAEGARSEASAVHLASCDRCSRELIEVRAAMTAAANVDVPEPSPLFWEHFSARVHEAIASEGELRRFWWVERWSWSRRAVPLSIGALAAVVIAAALTVRHDYPRPPSSVGEGRAEVGMLPDDRSLDLVADLSAEIDWDAAGDAGLTTREGAADNAVTQLTDAERVELHRLLEQALKRSGD